MVIDDPSRLDQIEDAELRDLTQSQAALGEMREVLAQSTSLQSILQQRYPAASFELTGPGN
jgi:hypothetical protein